MDTVETNNIVEASGKAKINIENAANDTTEVTKADGQSLKDWFKEKYDFLKEEKNLGLITWLTTLFTTLAVAYLKLIRYVSESGKLAYWNLPFSIIDVADDNALYDIIMSVVFAAVIMAILLIPYLVIKSRMRLLYKIVLNLILAAFMSLVMFFSGSTKEIVMNNGWRGVVSGQAFWQGQGKNVVFAG